MYLALCFLDSSLTFDKEICVENVVSSQSNFYIFVLGQVLHGIGGATLYTIGIALLDDSINPLSTPMYLGNEACIMFVWIAHDDCFAFVAMLSYSWYCGQV